VNPRHAPDPAARAHRPWRIDWKRVPARWLPFADAASPQLPLARLLRLSLFQLTVGMATVLLMGTLNRVMIVELGVSASLVSLMVALPLLVAPWRALVGWKSDTHKSFLGWRRVPFLWLGTMLQFGGLAIMPFSLLLLGSDVSLMRWTGMGAAALAFLLTGAGLQTAQTAGLALATDLSDPAQRPRVVALMYVMLLLGIAGCGLLFGTLLAEFTPTRLVQVVQGAAVASILLNVIALWKQEPRVHLRRSGSTSKADPSRRFALAWKRFAAAPGARRFMISLGLGTAAFNMQDVILEPYGGEILGLSVGQTTQLTAILALGMLMAFGLAARQLARQADAHAVAALGVLVGLAGFSAVIFSQPLAAAWLFRAGVALIGFGSGCFAVGTLTAAMSLENDGFSGLALGTWGAVQATSAGLAIALGGPLRDLGTALAMQGSLGEALVHPATGYSIVYHLELALLFATLVAIGPLVHASGRGATTSPMAAPKFGLAEFPS
jgi:BCD family chlorophyll transporter-like MFS transporter